MLITSNTNDQIKNLIQLKEKSKERKKQKCFVVEGIKMYSEIPEDQLVSTYVSTSFLQKNRELLENKNYVEVSDSVFSKISDTVTPQGILAVVKQRMYTIDDILAKEYNGKRCIIVLDRLQDPGNMGTIIRTGEGAGISGVIMSSDSVDIYSPKVIRSTMGSIFRVPFVISSDLCADIETLKKSGITTYAAHLKGEIYNQERLDKNLAFLIGNEAKGLSDAVSAKADKLIKIPMAGEVDSLNASIAAAILMYEATR